MAFYAEGAVLVVEKQEWVWLVARKDGDGRKTVMFGDDPISVDPNNPPEFPGDWSTIECLYELAAMEGIERITVNGEQVFPRPEVVGEDRQE